MPAYLSHLLNARAVAHELRNALPGPVITACPEGYYLGAYGPDFFFYYMQHSLFTGAKILRYGQLLHRSRTDDFMTSAAARIRASYSDALAAYFFGYITHYCTDRSIHPLVADHSYGSATNHNAFERDLASAQAFFSEGIYSERFDIAADIRALMPFSPLYNEFHSRLALDVYDIKLPNNCYSRSVEATADFWDDFIQDKALQRAKLKILGHFSHLDFESLRPIARKQGGFEAWPAARDLLNTAVSDSVRLCELACHCILGSQPDERLLDITNGINFSGRKSL